MMQLEMGIVTAPFCVWTYNEILIVRDVRNTATRLRDAGLVRRHEFSQEVREALQ